MSEYVTAIDFGSSKIALAIGEKVKDRVRVIYYDAQPVNGIRNGEIQNDMQAGKVLRMMVEKAEAEKGIKITEAVTNISGKEICTKEVSAKDERKDERIISADDVTNLTNTLFNAPGVYEVSPQKYNVSNADTELVGAREEEIIGMRGSSLEGFFKVFYGKENLRHRRKQVMADCGISLKRCILSPIASARAVLTAQEMNNGVALVDIGKGLTEVTIIRDSIVRDIVVIPFGGESITRDICTETNLGADRAEELKVRYGCCLSEMTPENKTLELIDENGETEAAIQYPLLTGIVEARISEIFDAVRYILDNSPYSRKLPAGVVITGGSAYLGYIQPLAKAMLERKCRLDAPRICLTDNSVEGAFDAFASTAVGLLVEYFDRKLTTAGKTVKAKPDSDDTLFPSNNPVDEEEKTDNQDEDGKETDGEGKKKGKKGGWFSGLVKVLFEDRENNDNA